MNKHANAKDVTAVRTARGLLIPVWPHRKQGWRWTEDAKCWYRSAFNEPPSEIAIGERYAHADYGIDSYGFLWAGSTHDNWHGLVSLSFQDALDWVRGAVYPELGCAVWGKPA